MKVQVPLTKGLLADKYNQYASPDNIIDDKPIVSFPIQITDVPKEAKSLALTLIDWDAIPVGGFAWIHWTAANISPDVTEIPANNSQTLKVPMVQGRNSTAGGLIGNQDPRLGITMAQILLIKFIITTYQFLRWIQSYHWKMVFG